jgi:uncharacterized membrane protein YphA (DoxX/SURF4 family)
MKRLFTSPTAADVGLLIGRLTAGVFFLLAGIGKIRGGVGGFVDKAAKGLPGFLPESVGRGYLYLVPPGEVLIGALLILGLFTRSASLVASLLIVSFTIGATGWTSAGGSNIHSNVVFIGLTVLLMLNGAGQFSVDRAIGRRAPPRRVDLE